MWSACSLPPSPRLSSEAFQGTHREGRQPRDCVHKRLVGEQEVSIICTILYTRGCCVASVYLTRPETNTPSVCLLEVPPRTWIHLEGLLPLPSCSRYTSGLHVQRGWAWASVWALSRPAQILGQASYFLLPTVSYWIQHFSAVVETLSWPSASWLLYPSLPLSPLLGSWPCCQSLSDDSHAGHRRDMTPDSEHHTSWGQTRLTRLLSPCRYDGLGHGCHDGWLHTL